MFPVIDGQELWVDLVPPARRHNRAEGDGRCLPEGRGVVTARKTSNWANRKRGITTLAPMPPVRKGLRCCPMTGRLFLPKISGALEEIFGPDEAVSAGPTSCLVRIAESCWCGEPGAWRSVHSRREAVAGGS